MESCILDPAEFIPERVELDLDSLGLEVRAEGVDWGEAAISAQMVRQAEGESSSDGHREGVQIRIPIRVKAEGEMSLAEAAHKLQQKVGTWQDQGGWVRRDFAEEGGFAGSIGYQIIRHTAALSGLQGWLFAHRQDAPDVVLTATRMPIGYSTEEREQGPFTSAAGARHLEFTEEPSPGSADGLWRGRITNEGEEDWRGLIFSRECQYAPEDLEDPTAQLHYLAKNLTPKGGAVVKTVSGAEIVEHNALTAGWLTILSSEIAGTGHMTHQGPRVMWMRIYDPGEEAGGVELRLQAQALGANRWDESFPIIATPVVGAWIPILLGVSRAEQAVLGDRRWEWRLQARAQSGAGAIRIRDVYPLSTEQYAVLSEPYVAPAPDLSMLKNPASITDVGSEGNGAAWSNPSNAKTDDSSYATVVLPASGTNPNPGFSHELEATNFGFAIPEDATITGILFRVKRKTSLYGVINQQSTDASYQVVEGVTGNVYYQGTAYRGGAGPEITDVESDVMYGGSEVLFVKDSRTQEPIAWTPAKINDSKFGFRYKCRKYGDSSATISVNRIDARVYYTEATDQTKVCFATRSIEVRSEGVFRQHQTDNVWGRLVPDGFLPHLPQGGIEGKATRTILIPSTGDLEKLPDSATSPALQAATFGRDGCHFAREAAA